MRQFPLLALLGLACDPFARVDESYVYLNDALWDDQVVAATDGVYVRLPHAGKLVRVRDDGTFAEVDLNGAQPLSMLTTPDNSRLLVFSRWLECEDPDPEIKLAADCDEDELHWNGELNIVEDGKATGTADVPEYMNKVAFNRAGSIAVAYLDYDSLDAELEVDGIINPNEVVFVPLNGGESTRLNIGFAPDQILFTEDDARAVVLSRSQVVVIDLATLEQEGSFPLVLDADQVVDPRDAILTPDGQWVLLTVEGSSELYQLNIQDYFIDIEDLDAQPSDLQVVEAEELDEEGNTVTADYTFIAYEDLARIDVLDNSSYELSSPISLDEPATNIQVSSTGDAIFYNSQSSSTYDLYRYNPDSRELVEYVLDNPIVDVQLSASGRHAVATLEPESSGGGSGLDDFQDGRWGLGVVELDGDDAVSLVLESRPVGLEVVENDSGAFALLLMEGVEDLLQINLDDPSLPFLLELPAPPTRIGSLPDGRFVITHASAMGMISVLDPATGDLVTASGFGAASVFPDSTLPRRDEE